MRKIEKYYLIYLKLYKVKGVMISEGCTLLILSDAVRFFFKVKHLSVFNNVDTLIRKNY